MNVALTFLNAAFTFSGMSLAIAIASCGSSTELARRCGVSVQHVTNWQARGIPADRALAIAAATDWRVTPHQLRPDLYPNPTDGLPPELQEKAA